MYRDCGGCETYQCMFCKAHDYNVYIDVCYVGEAPCITCNLSGNDEGKNYHHIEVEKGRCEKLILSIPTHKKNCLGGNRE